jgi:hypothetical protein
MISQAHSLTVVHIYLFSARELLVARRKAKILWFYV